jgi:hypothetical protein
MEEKKDSIYEYIITEETAFKTQKVPVVGGWEWNMYEHIRRSTLLKNSRYEDTELGKKPFRNIIRPILNVQYRSEGFNVTDIEPYVDNIDESYKSLLVRKYHDNWTYKYSFDTLIDEVVESYVDYGLALVKKVNAKRPERVPLQRIAFCDQTDILSGPICEKHSYAPDQLAEMKGKWDSDAIDEAITMAKAEKSADQADNNKAKTPGRYIEVYELHAVRPETDLDPEGDPGVYSRQLHVVCFYKSKDDKKHGITLYKGKESKSPYKAIVRDEIYGRACGFGGIEELFEPQIWINYSIIQIREMLDVASIIAVQTTDQSFAGKNKSLTDLKKGEILTTEENTTISQVVLQPMNYERFEKSIQDWEINGRTTGSANDAQLGITPVSGTPLGTTQIVTGQGLGIHEFRQGRIATFFGEMYRDWIINDLVAEMNQGADWMEELSMDEMQFVATSLANTFATVGIRKGMTQGKVTTQEQIDQFVDQAVEEFKKKGNKHFMSIFKEEMKDANIDVKVNIAGKQKNLNQLTDKFSNIFRGIIGNPAVLQNPAMAKIFNEMLEASGLSPGDFTKFTMMPATPVTPEPGNEGLISPIAPPTGQPVVPVA